MISEAISIPVRRLESVITYVKRLVLPLKGRNSSLNRKSHIDHVIEVTNRLPLLIEIHLVLPLGTADMMSSQSTELLDTLEIIIEIL